jgi:hypothetical protein
MLQLISLLTMTLAFASPIQKRLQATTAISSDCEIVINAWNQMSSVKWNATDDCCMKPGVYCDSNGKVTGINWQNRKLPYFTLFKPLFYRDLKNNQLSGEIPKELGNLMNLRRLYFNFSKLNFIGIWMAINCLVKFLNN